VPTDQIRALRQRYREAHTAYYLACVRQLADINDKPGPPSREVLDAEAVAFRDLTEARRELLKALGAHYGSR